MSCGFFGQTARIPEQRKGDERHTAQVAKRRVMTMPTSIALGELQKLIQQGAILVDVLPADEYRREHLPGRSIYR